MRLVLVAGGRRPPGWVAAGFQDYARRLPRHLPLELVEVPLQGRISEDRRRLLAAVPHRARLVAVDPGGEPWSTEELAARLQAWLAGGRDVAFLVGGPEGLGPEPLAQAEACWSLSRLTLPHMLVRVVVAEQLYRAWSLLTGHPYHRG